MKTGFFYSLVMRENAVIVRNAVESDRDALFELVREFVASFPLSRTAYEAAFPSLIKKEDAVVLVAEVTGEVLGYCLAFDHETFYANGRVAWVEEIAVRSDKRGSGLGRLLVDAVEGWARKRESKLVGLATRRASAFYKALEYEESAIYFRKLLSDA